MVYCVHWSMITVIILGLIVGMKNCTTVSCLATFQVYIYSQTQCDAFDLYEKKNPKELDKTIYVGEDGIISSFFPSFFFSGTQRISINYSL